MPKHGAEQGLGGGMPSTRNPAVAIILLVVQVVFGIALITVGSLNVEKCRIDEAIPVWLIVQGIVLMISGVTEFLHFRNSRKKDKSHRGVISAVISLITAVMLFALFIMGNVVVYRAEARQPDFARHWWDTGCDKGAFLTALSTVIILDLLFASMLISIIIYAIYVCTCRK